MTFNKFSFKFGPTFALHLLIVTTMVLAQPATTAHAAIGDKAPGIQASPPTMLNGILNTYHPGTADAPAGTTSISIGPARAGGGPPIAAGDMLLVVQMQGADLDGSNDQRYGDGVGTANIVGDTVNYSAANAYAGGNLAANFSAGRYEYVTATGPVSGGAVPISTGLVNSYFSASFITQGQRTFQVIRVPQYLNAALSGTVSALRWDGSTGGIVVFSVQDTLDWNGNTIDVSTLGFRGGGGRQLGGLGDAVGTFASTDYRTLSTFSVNGAKGEGYAGTPRYINDNGVLLDNGAANEGFINGSYGRGASGNGGGGSTDGRPRSNSQNSGGGGGGNGGYGGMGGNSWQSGAVTGGFGGAPFPGSAPRVILGGGGGAGTTNDGTGSPANGFASSGAAGGGVVMIRACTIVGAGTIRADGATANQTVLNDGGGGGGAGGSVVVIARNNGGSVGNLTVSAAGGDGGITWPAQTAPIDRHGPGGGGGGGFIFTSGPLVAGDVSGGLNGTSTTANDPFGATAGGDGIAVTNVPPTCVPPPPPPGPGPRDPGDPNDRRESSGGAFLIPVTGFAPNIVTELNTATRPVYDSTDLRLEIPVLKVKTSIIGVQQKQGKWDVSWLLNQVGWLNGTAYPTWTGNSLLTGHVVDANGKPGVFFKLKNLGVGEYIFIFNRGNRYTYKVESSRLVEPGDNTVMKHEEKSYLTLITCDDYDEKTGAYLKRIVVRAVLVDVREAK
ncbi:MAG: class F sortase [Chloroflexi bacterium]|nr:class F sortase [Chloroflexota bacterium]